MCGEQEERLDACRRAARFGRGVVALCVGASMICVVWLLILPRVGAHPSVRKQINSLNRRGVDPSAVFYTDLDAMVHVESDITELRETRPQAFWNWSSSE
jgi:hypothetical protein